MPAHTSGIGNFVAFAACEERLVITGPDPTALYFRDFCVRVSGF